MYNFAFSAVINSISSLVRHADINFLTGIILMEMLSCNSKLYPIIISDEKC
jgi:hypothetical protein